MKYERYNKIQLDNGKHYIFDKLIFTLSILALLIIFFILVYINGGLNADKNFYVSCQSGEQHTYLNGTSISYCKNPLYKEYKYCSNLWAGACEQEYLTQGFTYGTPPPRYFIYFNYSIFILIILAFIINHVVHNRHIKIKDIQTGLDK